MAANVERKICIDKYYRDVFGIKFNAKKSSRLGGSKSKYFKNYFLRMISGTSSRNIF